MESAKIAGEYYLEGVREMASGFLLKPDGNFQFYFTYGALDRHGSGKWTLENDQLILNSAPRPRYDFALVKSRTTTNNLITIKIEAPNPGLLRHVFCSLENGKERSWQQMNQDGEVQFPGQKPGSVSLLLEFCPDRFSTIPITEPDHNEFIFRFEPTIMEVFFENFSLVLGHEELIGRHPLMEGDVFRYTKQ